MLEIRTFEGGPDEASHFLNAVWGQNYGGVAPILVWPPDFFEWDLFSMGTEYRDLLVGAYDGTKLAGTLFALETPVQFKGERWPAGTASWCTVAPEYRSEGAGKRMLDEIHRRRRDHGWKFLMAWFYRRHHSPAGMGLFGGGSPPQILCEAGSWIRVLDHAEVGRWELSRALGLLARGLGLVQRTSPRPAPCAEVRPYRPDDLPGCLETIRKVADTADFAFAWTPTRWAHQLCYRSYAKTLVAVHEGRISGFINYHPIALLGRFPLSTAMIDFACIGGTPYALQKSLLAHALARMRDEGIHLAFLPQCGCVPRRPLAATGFIPMNSHLTLGASRSDESMGLSGLRRLLVHIR